MHVVEISIKTLEGMLRNVLERIVEGSKSPKGVTSRAVPFILERNEKTYQRGIK